MKPSTIIAKSATCDYIWVNLIQLRIAMDRAQTPYFNLLQMLGSLLHLALLDLALQIMSHVLLGASAQHDPWRVREDLVHLLQRHLLGLGEQKPEEERIGKVTDDKHIVIAVSDVGHRNGSDLSDHRVEGV